jgi:hypothetical protein
MSKNKIAWGLIAGVLVVVAIGSSGSSAPEKDAAPSSPQPTVTAPLVPEAEKTGVIRQKTEPSSLGLNVKFTLAHDARCTIDTDGDLLPNQRPVQNRPKGWNVWAVLDATHATVYCEA